MFPAPIGRKTAAEIESCLATCDKATAARRQQLHQDLGNNVRKQIRRFEATTDSQADRHRGIQMTPEM
jgi:hypothetical protein